MNVQRRVREIEGLPSVGRTLSDGFMNESFQDKSHGLSTGSPVLEGANNFVHEDVEEALSGVEVVAPEDTQRILDACQFLYESGDRRDGKLALEDIAAMFQQHIPAGWHAVKHSFDVDDENRVSLETFAKFMSTRVACSTEELLDSAFHFCDINRSEEIMHDELQLALSHLRPDGHWSDEEIKAMVELSANEQQLVTRDSFKRHMSMSTSESTNTAETKSNDRLALGTTGWAKLYEHWQIIGFSYVAMCKEAGHHARVKWLSRFALLLFLTSVGLVIWYMFYKDSVNECTHGTAMAGDVTVPNNPTPLECICIMYGYAPYVVALYFVIKLVRKPEMWVVMAMLLSSSIVLLNEGIVKQILKQDRPSGSCLHSNGMPSSHAELSISWWLWIMLEVFTKDPLEVRNKRLEIAEFTGEDRDAGEQELNWLVREWRWRAGWRSALLSLLLLPVPASRVVLQDHSVEQVLTGSSIGFVLAICWYFLLTCFLHKYFDQVADIISKVPLLHCTVNTYIPLPPATQFGHRFKFQTVLQRAKRDKYVKDGHHSWLRLV